MKIVINHRTTSTEIISMLKKEAEDDGLDVTTEYNDVDGTLTITIEKPTPDPRWDD